MRPVGSISTATTMFGQRLSMPVFVSPAGVHALCDEAGECASARACGRVGTLFGLSQHATRSIEQVSDATEGKTLLWYQSYILKDREMTLRLVRRAANAGYQGTPPDFATVRGKFTHTNLLTILVCDSFVLGINTRRFLDGRFS